MAPPSTPRPPTSVPRMRSLPPCASSPPAGPRSSAGSQYLGLGYARHQRAWEPRSRNRPGQRDRASGHSMCFDFNLMGTDPIYGQALPGTYSVTSVGATPIVVFVNPSNESGFGSLLVQNIDRAILAGYLDGTYGRTADLIPQAPIERRSVRVHPRAPVGHLQHHGVCGSQQPRTPVVAGSGTGRGRRQRRHHRHGSARSLLQRRGLELRQNPLLETAYEFAPLRERLEPQPPAATAPSAPATKSPRCSPTRTVSATRSGARPTSPMPPLPTANT